MKGRYWGLIAILVLLGYLIFSRLTALVVETDKPAATPTQMSELVFASTLTLSPILPTPSPAPTRTHKPTATRVVPLTNTPTPESSPTSDLSPGATATTVPVETRTGRTTHVVQLGENLSQIAQRYGVSVEAIVQATGLENPSLVYSGQTLIIPAPGEVFPTATLRPPTATLVPTTPPPIQRPAFQYTPTGWWGDYNPGLTRFMGEIKDVAGNPVNGVFIRATCGSYSTISKPSGSPGWEAGFYDITVNTYPVLCMWTLQVVYTDDPERVIVKAELSEAVPVEVTEESSIIVANWRKNW